MTIKLSTIGLLRRLAIMTVTCVVPIIAIRADEPLPPFTIKVTEQKIDPLPDYMGPGNKVDMDFPFCPVVINGEFWIIYKNGYRGPVLRYKGANMETAVRQPDGAATFPIRGGYILGGMWYDKETKTLYAPLHCEVATYPSNIRREIHLASSTDEGLTWKYLGPIITNPPGIDLKTSPDAESGLMWDGGNGDHIIYVDERGGYIYLYSNHDMWPKFGSSAMPLTDNRVARCAIADKMAPGKWKRFYHGGWTEPGIEGKSSRVDGDVVAYNTYLKKYLSFGGASSLSMCDDLSTQNWTTYHQVGPYWSSSGMWAVWPTDETKTDTRTIGQNFFVYNFWQATPGRLFQCTLDKGTLPDSGVSSCLRSGRIGNEYGGDAAPDYGYFPLYESDDPVLARHTRRLDLDKTENTYTGTWADATGDLYYENRAKVSSTTGDSVSLTFTGSDIYWHGVRAPDLGKADVFIDGKLDATVDCWASVNDPLSMTYMKRGLGDGEHTIKVVVKGEKNPLSSGTTIKHMMFEYGADSYRASDGFSSIAGKNLWTNQERSGTTLADMTYNSPLWIGAQGSKIGFTQVTPGAGAAVRKWIAPHEGTVRLEGTPTLDGANSSGVAITILKNDDKVWSAKLTTPEAAPYDTNIQVKAGDALLFVAENTVSMPNPGPGLEVSDKAAVQLNAREGKPMKIGTVEFTKGLAIGKTDKVIVHLPQPGVQLGATIGLDASSTNPNAKPDFSVAVGNSVIFRPDPNQTRSNGWELWLDVNGATDITLNGGDGIDWANAKITTLDGKDIWLADLPVQGPRAGTSRVNWDPVITYTK
jgi:hypothetical protein